jgi:hypothetical protein
MQQAVRNGFNLKTTDTTVLANWYNIKNIGCITSDCAHGLSPWKCRLNKRSNTLILERICNIKETPRKLMFKIIKFSEFEIILEDFQTKPWHRFYYFRKNS